jgi:UDP-N-acetylglucosamine acyltransferase
MVLNNINSINNQKNNMQNNIHSTAIIHPHAKIGNNIDIEAYALIGEHVTIGDNTSIGAFTIIEGITSIGNDNNIGHHSVIGGRPQDMKYDYENTKLIIGNNNTIREFVTIHTGTVQDNGLTIVGDNNWIMSYVHLAHDCRIASNVILSNNAQLAGHVKVDDYAIVGGMTGVHQFVHIGAHAMIGGASSLVQDVPPYVMAAGQKAAPYGINSTGIARRGFTPENISAIKQAYKILYRDGLSFEDAKVHLHDYIADLKDVKNKNNVEIFVEFITNSERGIIR